MSKLSDMSWSQRFSTAGATMRDTSHALRGERSSYLSDYMSQVREMEEQELQAKTLKDVAETFDKEGVAGIGKKLQESPDNRYLIDAVTTFGNLKKTMSSMQPQKSNTLFDMYRGASDDSIEGFLGSKREGGFMGSGFGPGSTIGIDASPATVQAIKDIRTVEDIEGLVANRDEYMAAGVDVDAVIDYYRKD